MTVVARSTGSGRAGRGGLGRGGDDDTPAVRELIALIDLAGWQLALTAPVFGRRHRAASGGLDAQEPEPAVGCNEGQAVAVDDDRSGHVGRGGVADRRFMDDQPAAIGLG